MWLIHFSPLKTIVAIGSGFPSFFLGIPLADSTMTRNISEWVGGGGVQIYWEKRVIFHWRTKRDSAQVLLMLREEGWMKKRSLSNQRNVRGGRGSAHSPLNLPPVKFAYSHLCWHRSTSRGRSGDFQKLFLFFPSLRRPLVANVGNAVKRLMTTFSLKSGFVWMSYILARRGFIFLYQISKFDLKTVFVYTQNVKIYFLSKMFPPL